MAEVKGAEAERLLRNLPENVSVYLICGIDSGLVSERVSAIIKGSVSDVRDPFQVVEIDGNSIATDPNALLDEVYTIGLFGGRRVVRVNVGSRAIHSTVESILKSPPPDCIVIMEAGAVKPDAPLRKLIASSKSGVVIDCWTDDLRQIETLIDEELSNAGLQIDPTARALLASLLGADRLATRSELAKLMLYARQKSVITEDDVEMSVSDASTSAFDELVWHAFSGGHSAVEDTLQRHVTQQDLMAIPALMLRHCALLHRLRAIFDAGQDVEAVVAQAYRVSFKRKTVLKSQVRSWTLPALASALAYLKVSVAKTRQENRVASLIAERSIWAVVSSAVRLQNQL
jgi:DNA polymerase-3 subunit delta